VITVIRKLNPASTKPDHVTMELATCAGSVVGVGDTTLSMSVYHYVCHRPAS
jgi:hypothetical protein